MSSPPKDSDYLVTVVIPTFNRRELLERAIRSVLDQSVQGLLVHVFDNHSDDATQSFMVDLCSRDPRVRYTRRDTNIGGLANYAETLKAVQTTFYLPLADDDWLLEGSIALLLSELQADPSLGAVVSQTVHMTEDGKELRLNPGSAWEYRRYDPAEFIPQWVEKGHFEWSSLMFRTEAKNSIGGLDINTGSPSDVDFQLQLFLRYPVKLVEHRSAVYCVHPAQMSVQADPARALGVFRMISKAKGFVANEVNPPPALTDAIEQFSKNWCDFSAGQLSHTAKFHGIILMNRYLREALPYPDLAAFFRKRFFIHFAGQINASLKARLHIG